MNIKLSFVLYKKYIFKIKYNKGAEINPTPKKPILKYYFD